MKKLLIVFCIAATMACAGEKVKIGAGVEVFPQSAFDTTLNGKQVSLYTISNDRGMVVQVTNYGARMVAVWAPSADGTFKDVIWGYESIAAYLNSTDKYCGPVVGRFGNRIGKGKFSLDGKDYQLTINNGKNHLHGGKGGFGTRVWDVVTETPNSVKMSYLSVDGEEGYPGNATVEVEYSLNDKNELTIAYTATTDAPTIMNPTSHAYFNLHGTSAESTNSHMLQINSDTFTPTNAGLIPTGELMAVESTPLDFRTPMVIGARLDSLTFEPMIFGGGYDHNWVLNGVPGQMNVAAEVYEPSTGIVMTVTTDQPAIQFYSGNFMDGVDVGKRGDVHNFRTGIALETQNYPDAPNHANFPSAVLRPGETYKHTCVYGFSVK